MKDYTIAVAGTGYVGLSIATLLSQHHKVLAVDIVPEKVELINNRRSPIQDEYIEKYLAEKDLDLTATMDAKAAYSAADFVVIAAPTNYDSRTQHFDTSAVEAVIKLVMEYNPDAIMVIKSTIPVGYTESVRKKFNSSNIIFSPEFYGRARHFMTTCIHPVLLSERIRMMSVWWRQPMSLQHCFRKVRSKRISIHCSWIYRGRGSKTICKYLSGSACGLLQRA